MPAELDSNGDQKLSRIEFEAGADRRFAESDQNHDGKVTAEELVAAEKSRQEKARQRREQDHLKQMDRDGSGDLDASEFRAAADRHFQQMDSDGDGMVDSREWRPPGPPPGRGPRQNGRGPGSRSQDAQP